MALEVRSRGVSRACVVVLIANAFEGRRLEHGVSHVAERSVGHNERYLAFTWYMGTLLALYWSEPSVYTSSVANAYFRPFLGLEGAGDGGKLCPSRSILEKAFANPLGLDALPSLLGVVGSDMLWKVWYRSTRRTSNADY